jgi:hypothetical protein
VSAAIDNLSQADYIRLEKFATLRVRGLGRRAAGRSGRDLLQEAARAALDGTRSWDRSKVDFVGFMIGAMRSISDNWGKRFKDHEPVLESELHRDDAGAAAGILERVASDDPTPESRLETAQRIAAVKKQFEGDALATLVICELEEGAKLREIRERYDLKENDFNAALKRIRRKVARLEEEDRDG